MKSNNKDNDFYKRVYEVVNRIPAGRVTTYGAIAAYLGTPKSARMVGWALKQTLESEEYVPAHRVVNRNGMLTGRHTFPGNTMTELLEAENIKVINNKVANFKNLLWIP